jgi:GNAT superfamily N-acetyltransferase
MPQKIFIRPALATDAEAIGQLALQFSEYLQSLGDTMEFKLTAEAILRDGFGDDPAFEGLVAVDAGIVIGYLLYHMSYDSDQALRTLDVADLYVDAAARRQGVGKALMAEAARIALERGAGEMVWAVFNGNAMAASFYEKLGARQITDIYLMRLKVE